MIICGYTLQSGHDNLPHIHLGLVNLPQFSALRAAELDKSWSCWLGNVVVMSKGCAVNLLAKPANFVCQCALIMIVPEYVDCFLFVFSPSPRPPPTSSPPHPSTSKFPQLTCKDTKEKCVQLALHHHYSDSSHLFCLDVAHTFSMDQSNINTKL